MNVILVFVLTLISSHESNAFLGFGNKKVLLKDVCGPIKDKQLKNSCTASFFNTDNKTSDKQKLLPMCKKLSETIDDLSASMQNSQWNYVIDCLNQIGTINEVDFPEKQIEFCEKLVSKSRNGAFFLPCLEKFNPNILEICEMPLKKGSYGFTADCLKATQGYNLDTLQVADLKTCTQPDKNQQLAIFSWATFSSCLKNKLELIPGNPVRSRYNENAPASITGDTQR